VVLDLTMPHLSGEDLLPEICRSHPGLPVIIMTGLNEIEIAVRCMRAGAFDYMVKPVEPMRLVSGVRNALEMRSMQREQAEIRARVFGDHQDRPEAFAEIVTASPRMAALFRYMEAVAPGPRPVLITGETGVGKELFAKALHLASGRTGGFVTVNVAGLDDQMFSDALFGHVKGAFTGADKPRTGLVAAAAGGTLFLDEFGDLSMPSQVKLLRLLQGNEYTPLGSDVVQRSTARIVAATNADLDAMQREGRFRTDLYYRLQSHQVHIPPLRERLDDLPLLLDHFLGEAASELGKPKPRPPQELLTLLATYHFPGNVRELEAMVYDAVSRHQSRMLSSATFEARIEAQRGNESGVPAPPGVPVEGPFALFTELPTLKSAQELLIREALRRAQGNQSVAAKLLGITQSGLSKALKRLNDNGD
jgi:DNA-binding NtrC family response regulator